MEIVFVGKVAALIASNRRTSYSCSSRKTARPSRNWSQSSRRNQPTLPPSPGRCMGLRSASTPHMRLPPPTIQLAHPDLETPDLPSPNRRRSPSHRAECQSASNPFADDRCFDFSVRIGATRSRRSHHGQRLQKSDDGFMSRPSRTRIQKHGILRPCSMAGSNGGAGFYGGKLLKSLETF